MVLWSFWSFFLLACALLCSFHPKTEAQAEVSFPRFHGCEETPLEARETRESPGVKVKQKVIKGSEVLRRLETVVLQQSNGQQMKNDTPSGNKISVSISANYHSGRKVPVKKCGNISEERPAATMMPERRFSVRAKKIKRSVGASFNENVDMNIDGEAHSRERFVETVQGVSNSRTEYRRTGDEARGSNPKQSEPYLDTSTFALSGDSAHNQAMVHWSGHNSSVSFSMTKKQKNKTLHHIIRL